MFFSSLLLTLLTCSFKLQAQDSLATFNPVLKDSLLKEELLQVKNQLYHLLLQFADSIEYNNRIIN